MLSRPVHVLAALAVVSGAVAACVARPAPSSAGAGIPLDRHAFVKALTDELDARAAADEFAGSVLVARDGEPIFRGAYGLADRERQERNTLETRFRLGSMNKMFTAIATLALVQDGKLALHDPLVTYLPHYPNRDLAAKVTIHHLLTHTGGTGDIFGPQLDENRRQLRTHSDYLALFGTRELLFEPGSEWRYSNYGFVLLGAVIEKVTGASYYEFVRDRVYARAGMSATGSDPEDQPVANRSIGYTRRGGTAAAWQPNSDSLTYRGSAAGGGYSTAGDLLKFARALSSHQLLNAEYTELLTTGKVSMRAGRYAYGFIDTGEGRRRVVGHGGGAPGMNGELLIFPASGYVIVALANLDPPAATQVARFIAARLPE